MEKIFEGLAIASMLPGLIWLFITIHVLHFSELKHGRFSGWFQFWPFYSEMKDKYPESSRWARVLTYVCFALMLPWLILKMTGI